MHLPLPICQRRPQVSDSVGVDWSEMGKKASILSEARFKETATTVITWPRRYLRQSSPKWTSIKTRRRLFIQTKGTNTNYLHLRSAGILPAKQTTPASFCFSRSSKSKATMRRFLFLLETGSFDIKDSKYSISWYIHLDLINNFI